MPDDAELLRRYIHEGAEDAFRELVQRRFGLVYAVALRQVGGDEHLARDVAQHVFVALARQSGTLSRHAVITGWLYRAARFTAIDVARAEQRRRAREQEAPPMQENEDNGPTGGEWNRVRPMLDDALSELDERDRDAVMLRVFEAKPFADIGQVLRVSEDAARMRVDRALEKLRRRLHRHGLTSTTAALAVALAHQAVAAPPAGLPSAIASAALASAKLAPVAATAGSLLTFMSSTKTVGAAASILIAIALGVGTVALRETHRQQAAADALVREIALLRSRRTAPAMPVAPATVPASNSAAVQSPAPAPGASAGEAALSAQAEAFRANYEARQRLSATNPAFQELSVRATRIGARLDYAEFFRSTGLTAAQIEIFEKLIVARQWNSLDLTGARVGLGLPSNDPALQKTWANQEHDFLAELRTRLGDTVADRFREFEATMPLRAFTDELAANLYHTETPLTAAQSDQLEQIVARHYPGLEHHDFRWRTQPEGIAAIQREARAILAPPQLAVLASHFDNLLWTVESVRELNRPSSPSP